MAGKKIINLINQFMEKQSFPSSNNENMSRIVKKILEEHQLKQVSGGKRNDGWYFRFDRGVPFP